MSGEEIITYPIKPKMSNPPPYSAIFLLFDLSFISRHIMNSVKKIDYDGVKNLIRDGAEL